MLCNVICFRCFCLPLKKSQRLEPLYFPPEQSHLRVLVETFHLSSCTMPKRADPDAEYMVERRKKALQWMEENGKKYKLTSRQQALDINNNMNNYYVPAPWKAYNKHKLCNQLFGGQLDWLQELLQAQGYIGKLSTVSFDYGHFF